jgi:2-keto-4-pentenoate hydratase/2-oxohepta-3-ene-1,7-dioic acid hydratase in catechol pathway
MRLVRYRWGSEPVGWGRVEGNLVELLEGSPLAPPGTASTGTWVALDQVSLLAPAEPTKVIGIGRNYRAHAAEHQAPVPEQPLIFLKPPSAVVGPGEPILLPPVSEQVEHEGELAVVIGKRGRNIPEADAAAHVLGYTAGNDVTARDLQRRDPQWTRGKGFDTFCPLGPWLETELDLEESVRVSCSVNGELRQEGVVGEMVFSVPHLIAYISSVMTLEPGDVILTGTPAGVGRLADGDEVTVEIEGVGRLANPVQVSPAAPE